ncbi:hypothetical protein PDE_05303 [Penicillium oxalicum 114-2]|uniref:Uncharacterized protein n=1 Tax=Penicillium oxalicum (strain 114-2 / CGMCC 5302) TaxID=933388 RepID=S8B6R4_PENO1|nr:hypothetical protein PDE_05303 [Penicillium oxalicum 114-2]
MAWALGWGTVARYDDGPLHSPRDAKVRPGSGEIPFSRRKGSGLEPGWRGTHHSARILALTAAGQTGRRMRNFRLTSSAP